MKFLLSLFFVFGIFSNTVMNAHGYEDYDPYEVTGVIKDYVVTEDYYGKDLAYFVLDDNTHWRFANFNDIFQLDWEVGDSMRIGVMFANKYSYATNLDKPKKKSVRVNQFKIYGY